MEAAWIALLASLGGVLLGGLLNAWAQFQRGKWEQASWIRQRTAQELEQKRALYALLPALVEETRSRCWSFVDYRRSDPDGWRNDAYIRAQQDKLEEVVSHFNRTYQQVRLVATEVLRTEAAKLADWVGWWMSAAFEADPGQPFNETEDGRVLASDMDAYSEQAQRESSAEALPTQTSRPH
jgi:hypothetical protein